MPDVKIEPSWKARLQTEFDQPYFKELTDFVRAEYASRKIFPPGSRIFAAFDACPFEDVKVVFLGQDPYHGPKQANGLSFSVNDGLRIPPSLQNIHKELQDDLAVKAPTTGNLENWAQQGVLLLNATLTVRAGSAGSHQGKGWETFTDAVVKMLSVDRQHLVFILWGAYAQRKGAVIDRSNHLVIESPHPSPLSAHRGFFGSKPFSRANSYLAENGLANVDW